MTRSIIAWLATRGVEAAPFYWFTSQVTPYSTPINGLYAFAASMEPKFDSLFSRRPRAQYGVERLAPDLGPTMTYGYNDAPVPNRNRGVYRYNGSKLDERNLGMAEGLTYHELAPGHHFQIALQRENEALPR